MTTPHDRLLQLDRGIFKLHEKGWDEARIARRVGVTEGRVRAAVARECRRRKMAGESGCNPIGKRLQS